MCAAIGIAGALPLAWGAIRLSAALMHMSTDRTLTESDVRGATGTVITPVPAVGFGEVRLRLAGQSLKYAARSDVPLPAGTPIYVTATLSPTSVEVVSTAPWPSAGATPDPHPSSTADTPPSPGSPGTPEK